MMAASAGDKCTRVLGSQSGAGSTALWETAHENLGSIDNFVGKSKGKINCIWILLLLHLICVTVCEVPHYNSLNTYERVAVGRKYPCSRPL